MLTGCGNICFQQMFKEKTEITFIFSVVLPRSNLEEKITKNHNELREQVTQVEESTKKTMALP